MVPNSGSLAPTPARTPARNGGSRSRKLALLFVERSPIDDDA